MKTPREWILERHQPAEAKLTELLDANHLAKEARKSATLKQPSLVSHLVLMASRFWKEALWPWRRIWAGMVPFWLVILVLNLDSAGRPTRTSTTNGGGKATAYATAALREQRQLMALLLEAIAPSPSVLPKAQGPRSELRRHHKIG